MQFKNILLLLSSALFIFACSSTKAPEENVSSASVDLMQKGFLLSLPEEDGWQVVKKGDYKVLLSKKGASGSYTIQALVVALPTFEDDDQFLEFIKNRMAESSKKHKVLENNTAMYAGTNEVCVQYTSKEERKSKTGQALTLEVASFTCRHPNNPNAGVYMALSKNYAPGNSDENMAEKAIELFNRLYFTEL
ncbi:MAG: hypothetical protein OQK75_13730 [Gammaproteobacteria bacterium]|nr:hypothetical protein [Gammaproteobacteria bacterium]MCW8988720.1 hypothetical protein [Gammaproteobacteria bacterium]MCW9032275.1 hypothetical protein [Gammaproteobacteria bacterium]